MTGAPDHESPFARVTILGTRRNADVVLPTREPLHVLVPSLLDLLDEPDRLAEYEMATVDGRMLDLSRPLGGNGIQDGQLLRLTTATETPRDPEVYDVVETIRGYATPTRGLWAGPGRAWGASLVAAAILMGAAVLLAVTRPPTSHETWLLAGAAGCLAIVARGFGQAAAAWLAWGAGLVLTAWAVHTTQPEPSATVVALATVLAVAGACARHGRALGGAAVVLLTVSAVAALVRSHAPDDLRTGLTVTTILVVAVGLAPRTALAISGVLRLDAAVTEGASVRRHQARRAIEEAHWSLAAAVAVLAACTTVVGYIVSETRELDTWQITMTILLAAAWALRGRHLPLVVERVAAACGAVALLTGLAISSLRTSPEHATPLALGVLLVAIAVALWHLMPISAYATALAARWSDRLEAAVVIALLPVLVGTYGVYADLVRSMS